MGRHHTKTDILVEVVDVVLVAVGATRVPLIIVEGTAAQHAGVESASPVANATRALYAKTGKIFPPLGGRLTLQILDE